MQLRTAGAIVLVCGIAGVAAFGLLGSRRGVAPHESREGRSREILAGIRRNIECRDFRARLTVTRTLRDKEYRRAFDIYVIVGEQESRFLADGLPGPDIERTRYWITARGDQVLDARMHSESLGTVLLDSDSDAWDKVTIGNLTYADFRHVLGLRPEGVHGVGEDTDRYVLRSVVERKTGAGTADELIYYIEKATYFPVRVDFLKAHAPLKAIRVEASERVDGRLIIRRARLDDFIDGSRTIFETERARFDQGLDPRLFIPSD